ncbi:MAG: VOC family protein [Gemmatimonadaceae bacterium]
MTTASKLTPEATATQTVRKGRFVWYDLMTTDVPAATAFYTKIAGWGTQDFDMGPNGTYQMWTVGDMPIGGVVKLTAEMGPPGTPPHWMGSVAVPSVDDTVRQAESLGGKVLAPPADIPTVGRYAVIADPQGAVIALFTPHQAMPRDDLTPKVGEFSWNELMTTDHNAAYAFYATLFDWEPMGEFDMGQPMGMYKMYGQAGGPTTPDGQPMPYGGMFTLTPDMKMPPSWVSYIKVDSADATAELVKSLGGQVFNGPMEVPGGDRIAQCLDPQGGMFAVHSSKPT